MNAPTAETPDPAAAPDTVPLAVDLDGTLVRSDLLVESLFALLRRNPLYLFLLPWWLRGGKARFKAEIAARVVLDPALLPYDPEFLSFLEGERRAGRPLLLVTASDQRLARRVADHLGLFERVLASDGETNLSGGRKARALVEAFGDKGFDYAANAPVDLAVWRHARGALLVDPSPGLESRLRRLVPVEAVFDGRPGGIGPWLRAMRPHQWLKNLLLFVPLLMAHRLEEPALLGQVVLAFVTFSLCASSVYLLNDLFDLEADRRHPRKRLRPFAAGDLPPERGILVAPVLLLAALLLSLLLPWRFTVVLLVYYLFTLAYSLRLKQSPLVDVIVLAGLYTLRIIAGAEAVALESSFWLLAFSMFMFFSLAQVKRYSELRDLDGAGEQAMREARGYRPVDLEGLAQSGVVSGYLSVLVLALYINSPQVEGLYRHPKLIWLLCPLMLYWIGRAWMLARRGEMHDDPLLFAVRDRRSWAVAGLILLILWAAA